MARTGFIPVEQQGGGGTALAHWDDNDGFFNSIRLNNRIELMTGFFIPNTDRFISRTTLATLVDMGYVVKGFNEDELIPLSTLLSNQFPPIPAGGGGGVATGVNSKPSGSASQPRRTINVYNKRRR